MDLSIWLSIPWYEQLSSHEGEALAQFLIGFIAIVPRFMNTFLRVALVLDKRPRVPPLKRTPSVTVLMAAYNE
jgi:biofilm PGA synthesis N-glycosyltransferase PgaC